MIRAHRRNKLAGAHSSARGGRPRKSAGANRTARFASPAIARFYRDWPPRCRPPSFRSLVGQVVVSGLDARWVREDVLLGGLARSPGCWPEGWAFIVPWSRRTRRTSVRRQPPARISTTMPGVQSTQLTRLADFIGSLKIIFCAVFIFRHKKNTFF